MSNLSSNKYTIFAIIGTGISIGCMLYVYKNELCKLFEIKSFEEINLSSKDVILTPEVLEYIRAHEYDDSNDSNDSNDSDDNK